MSIQRYDTVLSADAYESPNGRFVEFDAAQSELAALQEELAEIKESLAYRGSLLNRTQLRAEAAEQRNATLVKAATEFMEYAESGWDHFPDVGVNLRAALAQPAELGASK